MTGIIDTSVGPMHKSALGLGTCQVCDKDQAVGVCCVPAVPVSAAYCRACLKANAHPWGVLVANTACMGGLEHAAAFWQDMVHATCKHLDKTLEQFNADVQSSMTLIDGGP